MSELLQQRCTATEKEAIQERARAAGYEGRVSRYVVACAMGEAPPELVAREVTDE